MTEYITCVTFAALPKINQGFQLYVIPIRLDNWEVGPQDLHLNEHATDQVMNDLARILNDFIL